MCVHVLVIATCNILLIRGDVDLGAGRDRDVCIANGIASSDFRAFSIKGNGNWTAALDLLSLASIVNHRLVVFVGAVGEVHANNIETGLAELVNGRNRVGLRPNGADDRGTTIVLGWLEFGVELGQPRNLSGAGAEVVKSCCHFESK